jgi:hypothetical protein
MLVLTSLVLVGLSTILVALTFTQETTGKNLGVSGGIGSDARAWVRQHEKSPPAKNDVGTNLGILSDGVAWLKAHQPQLDVTGQAKLQELSRLPEKPKRLLNMSEQAEYYQAADSAYNYIKQLAGASTTSP